MYFTGLTIGANHLKLILTVKAYTNSRLIYNFSLFNKEAADVISKLFTSGKHE